jgi:hypothetical protein
LLLEGLGAIDGFFVGLIVTDAVGFIGDAVTGEKVGLQLEGRALGMDDGLILGGQDVIMLGKPVLVGQILGVKVGELDELKLGLKLVGTVEGEYVVDLIDGRTVGADDGK